MQIVDYINTNKDYLHGQKRNSYISLFTVAVPVNYTSEFLEILKLLCIILLNGVGEERKNGYEVLVD